MTRPGPFAPTCPRYLSRRTIVLSTDRCPCRHRAEGGLWLVLGAIERAESSHWQRRVTVCLDTREGFWWGAWHHGGGVRTGADADVEYGRGTSRGHRFACGGGFDGFGAVVDDGCRAASVGGDGTVVLRPMPVFLLARVLGVRGRGSGASGLVFAPPICCIFCFSRLVAPSIPPIWCPRELDIASSVREPITS